MSGAFDLSIMLQPASKSPERIKRYTRFSSEVDPDTLFKRLIQILVSLGVVFKQFEKEYKVSTIRYFFIFTVTDSSNHFLFHRHSCIYHRDLSHGSEAAHGRFSKKTGIPIELIYFSHSQGDILEFHKLYKLIHEKCLQK